MNKRGISPLIASVLLIAFAVTLFLIISTWTRTSILEPGLEKGGEKYAVGLDCLSTSVKIESACVDDRDSVTSLKLNVDNKGSTNIESLSIRVVGEEGELATIPYGPALAPIAPPGRIISFGDRQTLGDQGPIADLDRIEVFPYIKGGICQDNLVSIGLSRLEDDCPEDSP
tara:strand:- start:48707 stop:49219 length:513 start_codon:yes stop_codon:yes gene_type:complete